MLRGRVCGTGTRLHLHFILTICDLTGCVSFQTGSSNLRISNRHNHFHWQSVKYCLRLKTSPSLCSKQNQISANNDLHWRLAKSTSGWVSFKKRSHMLANLDEKLSVIEMNVSLCVLPSSASSSCVLVSPSICSLSHTVPPLDLPFLAHYFFFIFPLPAAFSLLCHRCYPAVSGCSPNVSP